MLGGVGPAGEPQSLGERPGVHGRVMGQRGVLAVLHEAAAGCLGQLQCLPHHLVVGHAVAVVGEGDRPGRGEGVEVGDLTALPASCRAGDHEDAGGAGVVPALVDGLHEAGLVEGGAGGGHAADGGEAAVNGGLGAGGDGLVVLGIGLAEVDVRLDQPGRDNAPLGVNPPGVTGRAGLSDLDYDAVGDEHIGVAVVPAGRIDDPAPMDEQRAHGPVRIVGGRESFRAAPLPRQPPSPR